MKVRTNFVSNSSSSSFIILYNDETAKVPGFELNFADFKKYLDSQEGSNWCSDTTRLVREGKDSILEYVKENWYDTDTVNKISESEGNMVILDISYHDAIGKKLLNFLIENKVVKVIYGDD